MSQICEQFGITRQAHYQKRLREFEREKDNQIVLEMVRQVRRKHPRMGTRKLLKRSNPCYLLKDGVSGEIAFLNCSVSVICLFYARKATIGPPFRGCTERLIGCQA